MKGRRWHGPRCNHYKYNARRIGYFQHGGTLTVSWRWGETGETKTTVMVQQLNWRLLLVTKECLVKRVGNWKSTCALFGLNVDPTQKASAHSFMLLSWISNSPGTGNWINEWKNIIVFLKFLVFVQSLAIAMSAGPCFCTGTKVCILYMPCTSLPCSKMCTVMNVLRRCGSMNV